MLIRCEIKINIIILQYLKIDGCLVPPVHY